MSRRIAINLSIGYVIGLLLIHVPEFVYPGWRFHIIHYQTIEHELGWWYNRMQYLISNSYFFLLLIAIMHGFLIWYAGRKKSRISFTQLLWLLPVLYLFFVFFSSIYLAVYLKVIHPDFNLASAFIEIFPKGLRYAAQLVLLSPLTYLLMAVYFIVFKISAMRHKRKNLAS